MVWFILALVVALLGVTVGVTALKRKAPVEDRPSANTYARDAWDKQAESAEMANAAGKFVLGLTAVLVLVFMSLAVLYTQSVGQGVIVTRIGGAVISADNTPGMGIKAPWDKVHKWDLFTRDISLSEPSEDFKEEFEAGEITGSRIATSVSSGKESGAQVWFDLDATYNIDNADLMDLFDDFRDQDRFTRQIVYPSLLKAANTVPSEYTTTQFRGAGSVEAAGKIADIVNKDLSEYGVSITVATVKNVRFTKAVEDSLDRVEEKQQQEESARADAAAKQVQNEQMIKDATAKAEANRIESESLTPELLQLRQIEGYKKGDNFYIPQGTNPLLLSGK